MNANGRESNYSSARAGSPAPLRSRGSSRRASAREWHVAANVSSRWGTTSTNSRSWPHCCAVLYLVAAISLVASDLKKDETIVLFPAFAARVDKGAAWETEIHGWVYEPEKRTATLAAFQAALKPNEKEFSEAENALFAERARLFLADNERGKEVTIRIGDKMFPVGKSAANGHFLRRIKIPDGSIQTAVSIGDPHRVTFYTVAATNDSRQFAGVIHLIEDTGTSVISDIDDTIKVSEVRNRDALLANTFLRPFKPVEGMAALYREWAKNGATFHYVSASPWQLYPHLADFILGNDFPAGTLHLKAFRWKDETFFDLFASPERYKPGVIEPLLRRFPNRQFIFVGDSGEKDPEIYGAIARKFPKQVTRILVRDVTNEAADAERYRKAFEKVPSSVWKVFREPKEIAPAP